MVFIYIDEKGKRTCGGIAERNGYVSLFFTFLFVVKNTHRTSIVFSTTAERFSFSFLFGLKGAADWCGGLGSRREGRACKGDE